MNTKKLIWLSKLTAIVIITAVASSSPQVLAQEQKIDEEVKQFEIVRYDVQGSTILTEQELNQALTPYVGKERNFETIQHAVESLEAIYRNKGFAMVQVTLPQQTLKQGVVKLQIVEPRMGKVTVTGNQFHDEANIRRSLPTIKEDELINTRDISTSLKLANENPTKKDEVQFQTAKEAGVVDANIKVTDSKPWNAAIGIDNTGDSGSGRNRITVALQHANIAGLDHVLSMQYTTSISNPSDARIFGLGYHIPLYSLGDSLDFYASYSSVDSGVVNIGNIGLGVSGNGTVYGTRYNHNFLKIGNYDSSLSAGLDYKKLQNNVDFEGIPIIGNNISVHPISLTYAGNYADSQTMFNFSLSALHNISGGSSTSEFESVRNGANPNYNLLRFGGNLVYALPKDWRIHLAINGQATGTALIAGEQFGVGGATSLRGFLERELINDKGVSTNLELYTPNLCSTAKTQCRLLGFYDAGYLSRNNALPGELETQSVSSFGAGLRFNVASNWQAQADIGHVIKGSPFSNGTQTGSNRAHFKVIFAF